MQDFWKLSKKRHFVFFLSGETAADVILLPDAFCLRNTFANYSHWKTGDRFIADADNSQIGIIAVVDEFHDLLKRCDHELWQYLNKQDLDPRFYALRWLMLLMAMEFQLPEVLRLWDSFLSDHHRFQFVTYFAIAMITKIKPELMNGNFAENLQLLQTFPSFDLYELLLPAMDLRDKYPIKKNGDSYKKMKRKAKKKSNKNNVKFKNGSTRSVRDLFGNVLRPSSTKSANGKVNNPFGMPQKGSALQRNNTFSFGQWKKKFSAKWKEKNEGNVW